MANHHTLQLRYDIRPKTIAEIGLTGSEYHFLFGVKLAIEGSNHRSFGKFREYILLLWLLIAV